MSFDDSPSSLTPWLARHRAGEPGASGDVLRHCHDRLKALTRQMLRRFPGVHRWEETSDVFHNVVLRLDRALRAVTFDCPADFLRLAACHIRRELLDLAKRRRPDLARADGSGPDPVGDRPAPADDPYQLAVWQEFHARVAAMPDEDRRLFDLLFYQGLTQPEAAALLKMPLKTLKTHWQNARLRLMLALGNDPPF